MEHGEALQESDAAGVFAGRARLLLLGLRDKRVGIDNRRSFLALADIAAERERLAGLESIAWNKVGVTPGQALAAVASTELICAWARSARRKKP